jgi:hypothetical protein
MTGMIAANASYSIRQVHKAGDRSKEVVQELCDLIDSLATRDYDDLNVLERFTLSAAIAARRAYSTEEYNSDGMYLGRSDSQLNIDVKMARMAQLESRECEDRSVYEGHVDYSMKNILSPEEIREKMYKPITSKKLFGMYDFIAS